MNYRPSSTYDGVTAQQNHRKWKYCKMKMHLIHLTYQTSQLSLGYLKHPQNTYVSLQLGKIIQHKVYFIMKCWAAHAIYGIMNVLKVTNRLYGYRMAVRVPSTVYPPDYITDRTLWLSSLPLPSIKKYHTAYQIKFCSMVSTEWYHFHTMVKLKIVSQAIISQGSSVFLHLMCISKSQGRLLFLQNIPVWFSRNFFLIF